MNLDGFDTEADVSDEQMASLNYAEDIKSFPEVFDFIEQLEDADNPEEAAQELFEDEIEQFAETANEVSEPQVETITEDQVVAFMDGDYAMKLYTQLIKDALAYVDKYE
jgi:hypothetical protein